MTARAPWDEFADELRAACCIPENDVEAHAAALRAMLEAPIDTSTTESILRSMLHGANATSGQTDPTRHAGL